MNQTAAKQSVSFKDYHQYKSNSRHLVRYYDGEIQRGLGLLHTRHTEYGKGRMRFGVTYIQGNKKDLVHIAIHFLPLHKNYLLVLPGKKAQQ